MKWHHALGKHLPEAVRRPPARYDPGRPAGRVVGEAPHAEGEICLQEPRLSPETGLRPFFTHSNLSVPL